MATILRDLIALTKPRIISLLLLTTIAPMFITDQGLPTWGLVGRSEERRVGKECA